MAELKQTPLYQMHLKYGGKIVDFGGWALPVQFTSILEEHENVRSKAGLFDVSHMGEVTVKGIQAEAFLQNLVVGDVSLLEDKQVLYTLMCYPDGGVVDDLLVYKYNSQHYLLVINASNIAKDFEWIKQNLTPGVEVENVSNKYAQLALQGPLAEEILQKVTDFLLKKIKFFYFEPSIKVAGFECIVSRTGYTGEDGFEIYAKPEDASTIWETIMEEGKEEGLLPVGLGARDTLRFEAKLPLYGQEIDKDITPVEAGLSFFVKFNRENFIGKQVLQAQKENGVSRKLIGFEMLDRGIPRSHFKVEVNGEEIGFVTTGSFSPTLKKNIGLALIKAEHAQIGHHINIVIRNKPLQAEIIPTPFYKKQYKK